jgi:hypothetical protein
MGGEPLDDSLRMALDAIDARLRRDSDEPTRTPLQVLIHLWAGYRRDEIEARLGISRAQYSVAWRRLAVCLRADMDD